MTPPLLLAPSPLRFAFRGLASILKAGRVVLNVKGNDYRLVARVQYQTGVLAIRFFGSHAEYDKVHAETV